MERLLRTPIALLLLLVAACSQSLSLPMDVSITTLPNGLTVIAQEDHAAELVGIDIWVKAGTRFETADNNGVSHFLEHLLFGATEKRKAGDMDREMESLGATLNAHTHRDYTHFSTTISSRFLTKALDIFADAFLHSQFPAENVELERLVILDEIARKQSNPIAVCRDLLAARVFGSHPYRLPLEGTIQSIRRITRDDILDYYRRCYVPANIAIVLVGDFDKSAVISAVATAFEGASGTIAAKPPAPKAVTQPSPVEESVKMDFKSSYLAIGFLGPPAASIEDVCAMDVLLTYLGQGHYSWLTNELRNKHGIVGEASADFVTQHDPGLINIIASAKPADLPKAREAILAKLTQMSTSPVETFDIDRAKRSLLGQYAFQNETVGGRAGTLGFYYAVSDASFAARYEAMVQAVTPEAVMQVAKKYMDPAKAVIVTVGPDQGGGR